MPYYYNKKTQATSWEKPDALKTAAEKDQKVTKEGRREGGREERGERREERGERREERGTRRRGRRKERAMGETSRERSKI